MTLVELLVVIAVLAVLAGVSALAMRLPSADEHAATALVLAGLRTNAIRHGAVQVRALPIRGGTYAVAALPDGRVFTQGDSLVSFATGRPRDASR